jgi:ASCH domain
MIPALSVRQPWAHSIIHLGKDVENRTWRTHYRGPLLIHASSRECLDGWCWLGARGIYLPVDVELPMGGVVGQVDLVDVIEDSDSPWAMEDYWHWVLQNPRPLPFRVCKGRLGLFSPDPS